MTSKVWLHITPIARIDAIPSAASAKSDDAGGLYPVVFLTVGAQVMLTANLWQEVGLCNGAAGTVYQILYQDGTSHHISQLLS